MNYLTGNQVRQKFLDFFVSKGHMIEPGVSLVPINDPTLLWINAGVSGLKKYFDGLCGCCVYSALPDVWENSLKDLV